ncbi:MarR family transcriptional regulator [soil metagenome]
MNDEQAALATATEIRVLASRLRRRLRAEAQAQEYTEAQVMVMTHLFRENVATVTALAEAAGVRPQSMGATVAGLLEAGLIIGSPDPADGRRTLLTISDDARKTIEANRSAKEDWLFRTIRSTFTESEQKELARGVELLTRLVNS